MLCAIMQDGTTVKAGNPPMNSAHSAEDFTMQSHGPLGGFCSRRGCGPAIPAVPERLNETTAMNGLVSPNGGVPALWLQCAEASRFDPGQLAESFAIAQPSLDEFLANEETVTLR
jgi:hypothetical protein